MSRICVLISDSFPFWCQLLRSGSKFQFDWDFMDLVTQSYWMQWLHSWVNDFLYESPWNTMKITSNIIISMSGIHSEWFLKHIVLNFLSFDEGSMIHQIFDDECLGFAFWSVIPFRSDASCFDLDPIWLRFEGFGEAIISNSMIAFLSEWPPLCKPMKHDKNFRQYHYFYVQSNYGSTLYSIFEYSMKFWWLIEFWIMNCLLYTSPSPRD